MIKFFPADTLFACRYLYLYMSMQIKLLYNTQQQKISQNFVPSTSGKKRKLIREQEAKYGNISFFTFYLLFCR